MQHQGIAYQLSGAGGNIGGIYGGAGNDKSSVYGFMKSRLYDGKLFNTYYYTYDKKEWKTWDSPVFDLIKGKQLEDHQTVRK